MLSTHTCLRKCAYALRIQPMHVTICRGPAAAAFAKGVISSTAAATPPSDPAQHYPSTSPEQKEQEATESHSHRILTGTSQAPLSPLFLVRSARSQSTMKFQYLKICFASQHLMTQCGDLRSVLVFDAKVRCMGHSISCSISGGVPWCYGWPVLTA